jgi:hypothetical protein
MDLLTKVDTRKTQESKFEEIGKYVKDNRWDAPLVDAALEKAFEDYGDDQFRLAVLETLENAQDPNARAQIVVDLFGILPQGRGEPDLVNAFQGLSKGLGIDYLTALEQVQRLQRRQAQKEARRALETKSEGVRQRRGASAYAAPPSGVGALSEKSAPRSEEEEVVVVSSDDEDASTGGLLSALGGLAIGAASGVGRAASGLGRAASGAANYAGRALSSFAPAFDLSGSSTEVLQARYDEITSADGGGGEQEIQAIRVELNRRSRGEPILQEVAQWGLEQSDEDTLTAAVEVAELATICEGRGSVSRDEARRAANRIVAEQVEGRIGGFDRETLVYALTAASLCLGTVSLPPAVIGLTISYYLSRGRAAANAGRTLSALSSAAGGGGAAAAARGSEDGAAAVPPPSMTSTAAGGSGYSAMEELLKNQAAKRRSSFSEAGRSAGGPGIVSQVFNAVSTLLPGSAGGPAESARAPSLGALSGESAAAEYQAVPAVGEYSAFAELMKSQGRQQSAAVPLATQTRAAVPAALAPPPARAAEAPGILQRAVGAAVGVVVGLLPGAGPEAPPQPRAPTLEELMAQMNLNQ